MSLPTFTFSTTAEEVATAFAEQIKGKNVLITGTSLNGLGFETARAIAKDANLVVITGYNLERLRLSEKAIKKDVPSANIRTLVLDLTSLAAVRKAAVEVNAYPEPLHVLIHNAAGGNGPFTLTADGFEAQMAVNHISPFLLTKLVLPKLLAGGTASYTPRVVYVSSVVHAWGPGHPVAEKYNNMEAYSQSKSANILAAIELSKRSQGKINGNNLHPGTIFTTGYQKEENKADLIAGDIVTPDGLPNAEKFEWKTIPQGAATTVAAGFDPKLDDKPGAFLWDCVEANDKIAPHSSDPANAEKLWTITEKLIGETFTF
ncbi:hypothetical protein C8R44DRAFT_725634 [Mycena epipterygia]|nr:hypothetical protein C8R44DRAFT_725634 [Mycena epipterygia]